MPGNSNGYVGDDVAIFFVWGVRKTRRRRCGRPSGEPARRIIAVNPGGQSVQWIGAATRCIQSSAANAPQRSQCAGCD
ncbi:hypothetical protein CPBF424_09170 [Xanthomonas euroxanthea]|uniref:Uncharacterized protein n=1 Tax=Xanthomonas euroxanthea TaxID=2259622 RepID=A0AA46C6C3_9XANT|nr:hypothetical protein CPBF424_09170 [Xanthomonas euroxanthea]